MELPHIKFHPFKSPPSLIKPMNPRLNAISQEPYVALSSLMVVFNLLITRPPMRRIEITINTYQNNPIAYRSDDREVAPHFYRQSITATARLINTATGETLQEATNYGESLFEFESDLSTSKRNTQSEAANELARLLFSDLIETWP